MRAVCYAWIHLVKDSHWLKAIAACACLEVSNSSEWVDGGGSSYRNGKQDEKYLGIPFDKQVTTVEHVQVDVEHAHMLLRIAEKYAKTQADIDFMLEGVVESWEFEDIYRGQLADMMEQLPG